MNKPDDNVYGNTEGNSVSYWMIIVSMYEHQLENDKKLVKEAKRQLKKAMNNE